MLSTTMSGARASTPKWTTSICPPFFFSSTALMLEEPTSRPTIDLLPNPNMCPPLQLPSSFDSCLGILFTSYFHLVGFFFHPLVEFRFLEAPAIAQFESRNFLLAYILVKRVRTHTQVLRRLANIHDFTRVGHKFVCLSHRTRTDSFGREFLKHCVSE